jgi:Tol biopolymer transport system component
LLLGAAAGVALALAAGWLLWPSSRGADPQRLARLSILGPPGASLYPDTNGVAISPDGTMVAFIVGDAGRADGQLWVRSLDSMTARLIEGGDGAANLFWSPDSRRIGFSTTQGKIKTIAASGGPADVLADAPNARGAVWTPSNVIIFAPDASGPLYKIPATGGTPVAVTKLDAAKKEYGHRFPTLLPDGTHFLYSSLPSRNGQFEIYAGSLNDDTRVLVGSMAASPVYADPGWLLYARQGVLVAQPFDATLLKTTGDPVLLDDEPSTIMEPRDSWTAGRSVSISSTGTLAYFSAPSPNTTAEWFDTKGRKVGRVDAPAGHYDTVAISPDGAHAAFVRSASPSESTIWLVDLVRGGALPLTSGRGRNDRPVWSPDAARIAFAGDRDGAQNLYIKTVGDAAPEELVFRSDAIFKSPEAWSPDGRWLIIGQLDPSTAQNVYGLPLPGGTALKDLVTGPDRDFPGPVSPDGKWMAYISNETGRFELYVQAFPGGGSKKQVSQAGARTAWWMPDGRQLLFLGVDSRSLWRADVTRVASAGSGVGTPTQVGLFPPDIMSVDATPDRQRFLALSRERTGAGSITLVQNWRAALDKGR